MRGKISGIFICLYEGHGEEEVKVGALAQHPGVVTQGEVGGDHVEQSGDNNDVKHLSLPSHTLSLIYQPEWSTLIGPDCRDTVLSLVEPYCLCWRHGAKVCAML